MAVDIGPRIGIEGEAEYRRQLNQIISQTKTLHAEMRSMESAWDKNTSAKQKATQQTQMLNQQIEAQKQRIEELNRGLAESTAKYGENDTRTLKWRQAVANANTELNQMEAELKKIPNSMQIVGQQMQTVGDKMTKVGSTLTKTITAPIVGVGVAAVKTASDFDTSMSKVRALSGATGDDYDRLRDKAREMGATTKYSATESADALGYMALAGWDTNQMVDGLDGVMNLAAASGMDLAEASDIVTDYLSAFGLEAADATKMADEMAYAQAHSNTTTTQLGEAFGNSAARMHTAGQSMETTTALLEAFANQGTKGSEAGTQLAATMRDIGNAMEDGHIQIGDTSIAVQDQNGNFRNLIDILADVEAATEGMGTAEKQAALQAVFTRNSYNAVSQALTEGTANIKQYEQELYNANGTAKTMAEVMEDNLAGQITKLKSAVQELGISLGDTLVPMVRKGVEWLQGMVDKFNALDDTTKENIVKFGLVAAAIGPVLTVVGKATSGIGSLVSTFGTLSAGMASIPFLPVTLAITGVATAIGLVVAANAEQEKAYREANEEIYATIDASEEARKSMEKTGNAIGTAFDEAEDSIAMATERAEMATSMVDRLEELVSAEKLSSAEMIEAKSIVAQLNAAYPGLNAEIDENGRLLGTSTEEMRGFIDNALEMATIEAKQQALKNTMQELTDAITAKVEAQAREKQITEELQNAEESYAAAIAELNAARESGEISASEYGYRIINLNNERSKSINDLKTEQTALTEQTDELNAQIQAGTDKYNAEKEIIDETTGALTDNANAAGETAEATEAVGDAAQDTAGDVEEMAKTAQQAYDDMYEDAMKSVQGQVGLFDTLSTEYDQTMDSMIAAQESQITAMNDYYNNLSTVWKWAVETGDMSARQYVQSLADMGIDGAGYVQQLAQSINEGTDGAARSVELFRQRTALETGQYASLMQQIKSDTYVTKDGVVWAYDAMANGAQTGMSNINAWVGNGMGLMQNTINTGMNNAVFGVNNSAYGLGVAANNAFGSVPTAANNVMSGMYNTGMSGANNLANGMYGGGYNVSNAAWYLANTANDPLSNVTNNAYGWGMGLSQNFANGMWARAQEVWNAAQTLATNVWSMMHHTTPEEGPLKDDDRWGAELVENFAAGMLSEIPMLHRTALEVAGAAELTRDNYSYSIPQSSAAQIGQALQSYAGAGDDITINVYASEGMNVNQLADQVQQRLALVQRQRASAYA